MLPAVSRHAVSSLLLLVLAVAALTAPPARAASITVTTTADELNSNGNCSLREAIRAANTDSAVDTCPSGSGADAILLPYGDYAGGDFAITADLVIAGVGATTSSVRGGCCGFDIAPGATVELTRLQIFDGHASGADTGGAIRNRGTLRLSDVRIFSNSTAGGDGGAIDNAGTLTIERSVLQNNTVGAGGAGAAIFNTGTVTLVDTLVRSNDARDEGAGAIVNDEGATFTMSGGELAGMGSAVDSGTFHPIGAIVNRGTASISGAAIYDNQGITIDNTGSLSLTDTAITRNVSNYFTVHNTGTIEISDSAVRDNLRSPNQDFFGGGGIENRDGDATLTNVQVVRNGDTGVWNSGRMTFADGIISQHYALEAGGGVVNGGRLSISGSTISSNWSTPRFGGGNGGGIANTGDLTLDRSLVTGNVAWGSSFGSSNAGGGILNRGRLMAVNSTISGNTVIAGGGESQGAAGGGIASGGAMTLRSVTVSRNEVTGDGLLQGGGIVGSGYTIVGSIVADNQAPEGADCFGQPASGGYNLIADFEGCDIAATTGDILGADPRLGMLWDNGGPTATQALGVGSPAIDAGPPASGANGCPAVDQRGAARPQDGDGDGTARCDIGAFELGTAAPPACPPGSGAVSGNRYTLLRAGRTLEVADLTGRVQPGDRITAYVTVAPGCTAVPIGLASYQAQASVFDPTLEQTLFDSDAQSVGAGEHQLTVDVPTCYFQADLIVGPLLQRVGPPSDYYRARQLDYATGGSSACPAASAPPSSRRLPEFPRRRWHRDR